MTKPIITLNGAEPFAVLVGEATVIDWAELRDTDSDPADFFEAFDAFEQDPSLRRLLGDVLDLADEHPRIGYVWAVPTSRGALTNIGPLHTSRAASYLAARDRKDAPEAPVELFLCEIDESSSPPIGRYRNLGISTADVHADTAS